jgi:HPt (histidine-containing phosphotransfer) domain-containing protein
MESGRHVSPRPEDAGGSPRGPLLDHAVLASLRELGGPDEPGLLLELVELFLDDSRVRLEEMRVALEQGDLARVASAAHTVKSAAASVGARLLSILCTQIEVLAREQRASALSECAGGCFAVYAETVRALREVRA